MESNQISGLLDETTISLVNIGIIVIDSRGFIVQWNHWMEKSSGYLRSVVLGRTLKSVFPYIENPRFFSAILQAITNGSASVLAQSIHHSPLPLFGKNKNNRIAQAIEIQPLKIKFQKESYCLIQISDVGSAVRREDQLRRHVLELSQVVTEFSDNERRTKAIVDISGDGIVTVNEKGFIESLNVRAEQIFGYSQEESRHQNVAQFFSSAYAEQVPSFIRQFARHDGLMQAGVWRILEAKRKNGEIFPINLNLAVVKLAGKNQIIGIIRDLTELEESERALQKSNDSLEMALASADLRMWDMTLEPGQDYKKCLVQVRGYEKGTFDQSVEDWINRLHPEDYPMVERRMQQHLEGKRHSFDCEYRLNRQSDGWLWIHAKGKVVARDDQGNPLRMIGINQDITRRKLAEIEAVNASEQTIEAARVKSEFLGNMSHELRTPMNGIMGVLNLLKHLDASEEQLEYIDVAKRSSESLLKMIDNVLELSKLGAKSVQLELIDFDPEEVLKDVVKLLSESAKEKHITIDYWIDLSSAGVNMLNSVTTDPGRLRQVLINLAANAIKFTHKGHVQIRLLGTESNDFLFEVEDSGIGIPKDRQHAIFDAFAQADVSTTRKYGGTGLGLGISKGLVELMGGRVTVVSDVDKGSIFSFTIVDHKQVELECNEYEQEAI